jgi:hypothetical protein|tara:strand:+ start:1136 stop:1618 length:483 start_codon:yes stop_codon:yes gene_type:complete
MNGTRHLIQCHCILPQYRKNKVPIFHKFVVFSVYDESGDVIPKLSECNNCGVVHNIIDFCKSEVVHSIDDARSIIKIDDIIPTIPPNTVSILSSYNCDISIWENIKFIYDNDLWGEEVVIAKDQLDSVTQVKVLTIKSESRVKIDTHIREEEISGDYQVK